MAKSCLGIDIGKDQLKLVLMKGENIVKTASVQMPEGLLKDGRIVSVETTGELIRKTMKENKIRCKEAAVVVSSGICFLRNVTMPEMTAEQPSACFFGTGKLLIHIMLYSGTIHAIHQLTHNSRC